MTPDKRRAAPDDKGGSPPITNQPMKVAGTRGTTPDTSPALPANTTQSRHEQFNLGCDTLWDGREGIAVFVFGYDPPIQCHFRWPDERRQAEAVVLRATVRVWQGLLLHSEENRRQDTALPSDLLWADCDDDADLSWLRGKGAGWVASGTPGRGHAYLRLQHDLPPRELEALNRRLALQLRADRGAWECAKALGVPGTYNTKHSPYRLVRFRQAPTRRWDPADLDHLLPTLQHSVVQNESGGHLEPRCVKGKLPLRVRHWMSEEVGEHRAKQVYRLVYTCLKSGLTPEETLWVALQHAPTLDKYAGRVAQEVARIVGKWQAEYPNWHRSPK